MDLWIVFDIAKVKCNKLKYDNDDNDDDDNDLKWATIFIDKLYPYISTLTIFQEKRKSLEKIGKGKTNEDQNLVELSYIQDSV